MALEGGIMQAEKESTTFSQSQKLVAPKIEQEYGLELKSKKSGKENRTQQVNFRKSHSREDRSIGKENRG